MLFPRSFFLGGPAGAGRFGPTASDTFSVAAGCHVAVDPCGCNALLGRDHRSRLQSPYCCGALGVGEPVSVSDFFLASAAFAVACCRRSASDFNFGSGVVWVEVSCLSEGEQAPVNNTQARKTDIRIVFIV